MSNRKQVQIALDIIRFTNISNDLFDEAAKTARGERTAKIPEIKSALSQSCDAITNYSRLILSFFNDLQAKEQAAAGLAIFGINIDEIIEHNTDFLIKSAKVKKDTLAAIDQSSLNDVATYIDNSITPLPLVRKSPLKVGG